MIRTVAKQKRTEAQIERDIAIYKRQMRGLSVRAIADEFGIKSTQTVHIAIQRGREHAKLRGIDVEETRITIQELFQDTLGALANDVREQSRNGVVTEEFDGQGNLISVRRTKGVSARTAGELSRSLVRWAQFVGIMEGADTSGSGGQATNFIQLVMPGDGGALEQRWSAAPDAAQGDAPASAAVDVTVTPAPAPELGASPPDPAQVNGLEPGIDLG
jgi:hypothetical protein